MAAPQESNISVFKGNPIPEEGAGEEKEALSPPESLRSWHRAAFFLSWLYIMQSGSEALEGMFSLFHLSWNEFKFKLTVGRRRSRTERGRRRVQQLLAQHAGATCECDEIAGGRLAGPSLFSKNLLLHSFCTLAHFPKGQEPLRAFGFCFSS